MALPGVRTTILDHFYNLGRTDLPGGPVLAIIAKRDTPDSADAPDLEPYLATGEKDVIDTFGVGSNVHRGYIEASVAGASRIVIIPLPEDSDFDHATGTIDSVLGGYSGDEILDRAFESIEAIRADIVVGWGAGSDASIWDDEPDHATPNPGGHKDDFFYADNSVGVGSSWAKKFSDRCGRVTSNSYPCFAVLGMKGFAGYEGATTGQISDGIQYPNLANKEVFDSGQFVSVVAAEFRPISYRSSWGWANGAATYGALAARTDAQEALTGKPVYNIDRFRFNPTRPQQEALNNRGIVTCAMDLSGAMKWVDACTFAAENSDFTRLTTLRIAFDVVKLVVTVADQYKGKAMSIQSKAAFETQISSRLRAMQQLGALIASDSRVRYVPSANQALIDLAITPAFELREIILTLSINF